MKFFILLICMLFCHIVDDYYLQGILSSMKQKEWWKNNAPQTLYKYDYIMALVMHSISWSFMITLPFLIKCRFSAPWVYGIVFSINAVVHCIVDNLKANKRKINLIEDQLIHIAQIVVTAIVLFVFMG